MNALTNFIKDIFMITPEQSFVGLSGIKPIRKKEKKAIKNNGKKAEPKLSDLMRRETKTVNTKREESINI